MGGKWSYKVQLCIFISKPYQIVTLLLFNNKLTHLIQNHYNHTHCEAGQAQVGEPLKMQFMFLSIFTGFYKGRSSGSCLHQSPAKSIKWKQR